MNAIALSIQLLIAAQNGTDVSLLQQQLQNISPAQLAEDLKEGDVRKTFWINCYNAFVHILIKEKAPDFSSQSGRTEFFGNENIVIAGEQLSLNDIEHGMLRHSKVWWSLGHLNKISSSPFEKDFRVKLDYRIHFALNCGASSCPAIRFYEAEKINEQLDMAMKSFLSQEVKYDELNHTATVSQIFSWYRADFGGKKGIVKLLYRNQLIPTDKKITLQFSDYDWTILLDKFE
jgi:hypothetical protein